jgi:hypothetical protein
MTKRQRRPGPLFHIAAIATAVFVLTVLTMIATVFANPAAPVNQWLNQYGAGLLAGEVALIAVSGCAAMARDQRTTKRDDAPMDDDRNA